MKGKGDARREYWIMSAAPKIYHSKHDRQKRDFNNNKNIEEDLNSRK